jgi:hypothetical protein
MTQNERYLRDRVQQAGLPVQSLGRVQDWKKPPVRWHRVRVLANCSGFLYRTQGGDMASAEPGEFVVIDSETLETRRRNVQEIF